MDSVYSTVKQKRAYERTIAKDTKMAVVEQQWYDDNMSPIQDLFGCPEFIDIVHKHHSQGSAALKILQNKKPPRGDIVTECDIMCSRGSEQSTHWLSKRVDQPRFFDPYDVFQYPGTNQWCQLNALMNLCVADRPRSTKSGLEKYYEYNQQVVDFIYCIFSDERMCPIIDEFWENLDLPGTPDECMIELIAHPNRSFNVVPI